MNMQARAATDQPPSLFLPDEPGCGLLIVRCADGAFSVRVLYEGQVLRCVLAREQLAQIATFLDLVEP